jgi:hypothetical protein
VCWGRSQCRERSAAAGGSGRPGWRRKNAFGIPIRLLADDIVKNLIPEGSPTVYVSNNKPHPVLSYKYTGSILDCQC